MVLPSRNPPDPAQTVRDLDRAWAERLSADALRYERRERRATWRRAGICVVLAAVVVAGGVAGFAYETNTRWAVVHFVKSPGYVTVTVDRAPAR